MNHLAKDLIEARTEKQNIEDVFCHLESAIKQLV